MNLYHVLVTVEATECGETEFVALCNTAKTFERLEEAFITVYTAFPSYHYSSQRGISQVIIDNRSINNKSAINMYGRVECILQALIGLYVFAYSVMEARRTAFDLINETNDCVACLTASVIEINNIDDVQADRIDAIPFNADTIPVEAIENMTCRSFLKAKTGS